MHVRDRQRGRAKSVSSESLIRTYQRETERQRLLVKRASLTRNRLLFVASALRRLMSDDHFVTLMRAEGFQSIPRALAEKMEAGQS